MNFLKISAGNAIRKRRRTARRGIGSIFALCLAVSCICPALAAGANPYYDPAWMLEKATVVQLGKCKIMVLRTYSWRDWMPIVATPGPDGGSPLRIRVSLRFDNSGGEAEKLSYRTFIVDSKGQSYPVNFRVLPNYHVLPDEIAKAYPSYDDEASKSVLVKYNVIWDGTLKAGETRDTELVANKGPYLPVGSNIQVRIEWSDGKGNAAVLQTPAEPVKRTD